MRACLNVQSLQGPITGIERYTYEALRALDPLLAKYPELVVEAIFPAGSCVRLPELTHIQPVEVLGWRGGNDYVGLRRYLRNSKSWYVNFSGGLAVQKKSVVVFHDLRPHTHPEFDDRGSRVRFGLSLRAARTLGCQVVTVSDFSRGELVAAGFDPEHIAMASNGWEHLRDVVADAGVFGLVPDVEPGQYYYVLGSLAPHKNLDWVLGAARNNPRCTIVMAGKLWGNDEPPRNLPKNVRYVGYVTDEQSRALMESCRAFLHPSLYEGFGIPPLEAICCGRRVLAARGTAVEGVYGGAIRYFDPLDCDVDLDELADFEPNRDACQRILDRYTWAACARSWLSILTTLE